MPTYYIFRKLTLTKAVIQIQCSPLGQDSRQWSGIQAVVFDKDGTLARSEDFLRILAHQRARRVDAQVPGVQEPLLLAFGVEAAGLNPAGLMAVGSRRDNLIAAAAYVAEQGRDWFAALTLVEAVFADVDRGLADKAQSTPLFQPARPLIRSLADQGVRLGLISGDTTANLHAFLATYHLSDYFSLVWGADRSPAKPDPACFREACATLGVSPEATLMVGDATGDMAMGQTGGAAGCIGVTWGWTRSVRIQQADVILTDWSQWQVGSTG